MTRPDVLISGGAGEERPPRQLPRWLRRAAAVVVVLGLLVVAGNRWADDRHRRAVALRAADQVEAALRISEVGLGVGATVVVGIQVSGRGREARVDVPVLRPSVAEVDVVGAPLTVAADRGSQIRLRLHPDCGRAPDLTELAFDLPITPLSGRRHLVPLPFPEGPDLVRRACGYLPTGEALTTSTDGTRLVRGRQLQVAAAVRNDGRQRLTVTGLRSPGLAVDVQLPVQVLPGSPAAPILLVLRVTDCAAVPDAPQEEPPVLLQVANESGLVTEVPLLLAGADSDGFRDWRRDVCP